jgi:F-type H+-transporting ATPase subunit delta
VGAVEAFAVALFSVARERDKIEEIMHEFQEVCHLIDIIRDFGAFLNHPLIPAYVKKNVIKSTLSQKLSQELLNLIFLSIDKNIQNSLKEILGAYSNLYRKFKNQRYAKVYTAVKLYDDEKAVLKNKLDTMFDTNMVIENIEDETILGGLIIRTGFEVIDGSLRTDLNKIKSSVLQGEYYDSSN